MVDFNTLSGIAGTLVQSAAAAGPDATYAAWAAELGVSASATLQALDGDDAAWPVLLAAPLLGQGAYASFATEGALGVYRLDHAETSYGNVTIPGVSRMYELGAPADLFFTFHPPADCYSTNVKLQRAGNVTILGGKIHRNGNANAAQLFFAIRMTPGAITFVLNPVDQPLPFNLFNISKGNLASIDMAAGATVQFDVGNLAYAPPQYPVHLVGGVTIGGGPVMSYGTPHLVGGVHLSVESGAVADRVTGLLGKGIGRVHGTVKRKSDPANVPLKRRVRLVRERDGLVVREAWSDAATGEYDFRYIDELQKWTVIAYDHEHDYRAVIADNLTPEVLP